MKICLFLILLSLCIFFTPLIAQDTGVPDTIYFGDNGKAYGYGGGVYKIPVYITTDQEIGALTIGLEYGLGSLTPTCDSATTFCSIFDSGNYLEFTGLIFRTDEVNGFMPDSCFFGGVGATNFLPTGNFLLCDIWFSGGNVGEFAVTDTAWTPPAGSIIFQPGASGSGYTPQFVGGTLEIVNTESNFCFDLPDNITGDVGSLISFDVLVNGAAPPVIITLDSIVKIASGESLLTLPPTLGTNPLTVEWTPTYSQYGDWMAYFNVTDANLNEETFSVMITAFYVDPPGGIVYGDADCSETIDISDAVYIINYVFNGGPVPGCGK